jgi:1-phosphofructokinase family hexose kinase
MIVTVTLNAAVDRTLLVPNFQVGQRHRASVGFLSAGGKGINVGRALKRLGVPVVCTGLAGGRTGTLLVEELTQEGILNDFVRIRGESRTSTAVLDPTSNVYTEINEWGPEIDDDELDTLREKLAYLTQGAEFVVFAGSLPRGVEADFFAEVVRDAGRRHQLAVVDTDGEPLRVGTAAEPYLVAPNVREAEELVGHEFVDEEDLAGALDEIAELGARNVLITLETGCYALLREDRNEVRLRAHVPELEPVSRIGAGDTLLAGFLAARAAGR